MNAEGIASAFFCVYLRFKNLMNTLLMNTLFLIPPSCGYKLKKGTFTTSP